MKTFGTLEFGYDRSNRQQVIFITGFQPTLLLDRLIPKTWHAERHKIKIDSNLQNTRYIKMIMSEYPLEILNERKWEICKEKLAKNEAISDNIQRLDEVEVNNKIFTGKLMNFQKKGLDFLIKTHGNALLADEMGLGKTVEALAFIATQKNTLPVIVVSPLVTLFNWQREIKKFIQFPNGDTVREPKTTIIRTGEKKTLPLDSDFYVINYELVSKRVDNLIALKPKTLVCDEIQNLRSLGTRKFSAIDQLAKTPSIRFRLGLSGTPIYNRGSEIWGMVDILQKGLLGSYQDFLSTYCHGWGNKYMVSKNKQKALSEILTDHVMIRRRKVDVLTDLPEKNRFQQRIPINKDYYRAEIEKLFRKIEEAKEKLNESTDNEVIKKQKIFELSSSYSNALQHERQIAGISKAPYIVEYIKEMMEIDEKIVVFVHHISVHDILMNGLYEFSPLQIIGGQSDKFRQKQIDMFQEDEDLKLIICGIRAGSMGINLTAGSYVIFGELDWSPPIHRQAEDRLHRIGQKKPVFAHYLIGENTMDETIVSTLIDKTLEIDAVMGDKAETIDVEKSRLALEKIYSKLNPNKKSIIRNLIQ